MCLLLVSNCIVHMFSLLKQAERVNSSSSWWSMVQSLHSNQFTSRVASSVVILTKIQPREKMAARCFDFER